MRKLTLNKNLTTWMIGYTLSRFGDSFTSIAMSILTYSITQSGIYASIVFLANILPNIFLGPIIGVIVDIFNKRKILIYSNLISSCILIILMISPLKPTIYIIGNFILSIISMFNKSSSRVVIPELVQEKNNLMRVNAFQSLCNKFANLAGMSIAGVLCIFLSCKLLFLIDAITFIIASITIIFNSNIKFNNTLITSSKHYNLKISFIEGITLFKENTILLHALSLFSIITFCDGVVFSHLVVYVQEFLNSSSAQLGFMESAFLFGTLIGQAIISTTKLKINELDEIIYGVLCSSLAVIFLGFSTNAILAILSMCLYGFFGAFIMTSWITLSQKVVDINFRGRATTIADAIIKISNLLGIGFTIIVYQAIAVNFEFILAGILAFITSLIMFCIKLCTKK